MPHQRLALFRVGLGRLPVDQLVDFGVAVAVVVEIAAATVDVVEGLVRVPDTKRRQRDRVVVPHDPREPFCRVDDFEFAVDIDLLQLVVE